MSIRYHIIAKEYGLSFFVCVISSIAIGVIAAVSFPQDIGVPLMSGISSSIGIIPVSIGALMSTVYVSDRFSTRAIGAAVCAGCSRANIYVSLVLASFVFVFGSIAFCVFGYRICGIVIGSGNEILGFGWHVLGDVLACVIPLTVFVALGVFTALLTQEPAKATILMATILFALLAIMMTLVHGGILCPLAMAHPAVFIKWLSERNLFFADAAVGEGFAVFWATSLLGGAWLIFRRCELR